MKIQELENKLTELQVPKRWYSINGSLSSDIFILNEIHDYWECFYVDERGNQTGHKRFDNEDAACAYFLEKIIFDLEYFNKKPIKIEEKDKPAEKVIYL